MGGVLLEQVDQLLTTPSDTSGNLGGFKALRPASKRCGLHRQLQVCPSHFSEHLVPLVYVDELVLVHIDSVEQVFYNRVAGDRLFS